MHFDFSQFPGNALFWEMLRVYFLNIDIPLRVILLLYPVILIYIAFRGSKKEKCFFLASLILLIVMCLNPWVCSFLSEKGDFSVRYFRFFWLVPVTMGYAVFVSDIYTHLSKSKKKIMSLVFAVLFVYSCFVVMKKTSFSDLYTGKRENTGMIPVSNIYKVENDVISISDIISKDRTEKTSKVLYPYPIFIEIRTYDPSILPAVPYSSFPDQEPEKVLSEKDWDGIVCMFFSGQTFDGYEKTMTADLLKEAVSKTDSEYAVIDHDNKAYYKIWKSAYKDIGRTENYTIFKVK